ncbi:hypothetical protein COCOBI_11-0470 [Coccomyxa sp. Obi]|nr:hypothetical protein COCOBI_11-0470 [Coccomyxa sp. Obi]
MNHPFHLQTVASVSSASRPVVLAAKDSARPVQRARSSKSIAAEQTSPAKGRTADLRVQKQVANENEQQSSVDRSIDEGSEEADERLRLWAMCVHGRGAVLQRYMQ